MRAVISDRYMDKLVDLKRADERKAVKESVRRFCKDPSRPGLNLERLRVRAVEG